MLFLMDKIYCFVNWINDLDDFVKRVEFIFLFFFFEDVVFGKSFLYMVNEKVFCFFINICD